MPELQGIKTVPRHAGEVDTYLLYDDISVALETFPSRVPIIHCFTQDFSLDSYVTGVQVLELVRNWWIDHHTKLGGVLPASLQVQWELKYPLEFVLRGGQSDG